jgi:hypothetical protein
VDDVMAWLATPIARLHAEAGCDVIDTIVRLADRTAAAAMVPSVALSRYRKSCDKAPEQNLLNTRHRPTADEECVVAIIGTDPQNAGIVGQMRV